MGSDSAVSDAVVRLPISWRTAAKATFFSGTLSVFGIAGAFVASSWLVVPALLIAALGVVPLVDLLVAGRRWRLDQAVLHTPTLWARQRSLEVDPRWSPGIDSVGRRDLIFRVDTLSGKQLVHPNLLLARSDVRQWLHLIGNHQSQVRRSPA